ncbi:MAG: NAD(P)/FAD-dependent oxidoreductase [Gammaproteobacteria bacterium]|nr:NAD(P)/FAD-dependent oxidoreductase [Gammaproteobacteria bacterium]
MPETHCCDVVVLGAGFSGLSAALRLEEAGADVRVIEAQGHVGGRIRSIRRGDGLEEAGGATIGGGYRAVTDAARRYGVELIDATPMLAFFREQELVLNGEIIRQAEWPSHPANAFPDSDRHHMPWTYGRVLTARHNPLPSPDVGDPRAREHDIAMHHWLGGLGLGNKAIALAHGINTSYGRDARDVSALTMLSRAAFSVAQRSQTPVGVVGYTARDGVQRIPEAMAAALGHEAHLNTVVVGIDDTGSRARVACASGATFLADNVICSLPFPVLRTIGIDPPLVDAQAAAVATLPSQAMTQVYLDCASNFWDADGYSPSLFTDGIAGMVAAGRRGENPGEVTGLTAWAMGGNAVRLDALSDAEAGAAVIAQIEAVRPAARGQLTFAGRQSWGASPFARGGWAYFHPGQVGRFAASMAEPHGRISFCGEHLARFNRGMEGAMESGERAAEAVLGRGAG